MIFNALLSGVVCRFVAGTSLNCGLSDSQPLRSSGKELAVAERVGPRTSHDVVVQRNIFTAAENFLNYLYKYIII